MPKSRSSKKSKEAAPSQLPVCRLPSQLTKSLSDYLQLRNQSHESMAKTKQAMNPTQTRECMEECIKLAKKEEAHIIAILDQLQRVIAKTEENEERKQLLPKNTMVCARVMDTASNEPMWILAKIVRGNASADQYEIEDAEDDGEARKSYVVRKSDLVLIPKSYSQHLGFQKGDRVLAMYPDTTCFYPARIADVEAKSYFLHFDDDDDETGRTPKRKVAYKYVVEYASE